MVTCSYAVSLNGAAILTTLCSLLLKYRRDRISFLPAQDIPRETPAPVLPLPKGSAPAAHLREGTTRRAVAGQKSLVEGTAGPVA